MEISQQSHGDELEIRLNGRFDAAWAGRVSEAIDAAVRSGAHRIAVNCASVKYISSLGLGVLLQHYKQLKAIEGSLSVVEPSGPVLTVIRTAGLAGLLLGTGVARAAAQTGSPVQRVERGNAAYEIYAQASGATLECSLVGQPEKFAGAAFVEGDCHALHLAEGWLGLGLGAFGDGFADCRPRFGEFLAAGGAAIALSPAEHGVPDYVLTQGEHVPRVEALYAVTAAGTPAHILRFDARADGPGVVGLSELVESALELAGADAAGFVMVAEAAGVVGATLRRSPATEDGGAPLEFPGVRDWLSFTTERAGDRHLALIVGMATRRVSPEAAPFLRPIAARSSTEGHFHAALFPYRPVQRGELALATTVAGVLSASPPTTVLHLMADTREFEGVGETDLMRGACWVGPIRTMTRA